MSNDLERQIKQKDKEHILACWEMIKPQCVGKTTAEIRAVFIRYKLADKLVSYYDVLGVALQRFLRNEFVAVPVPAREHPEHIKHIWTEEELLTIADELLRMQAAESRVQAQVKSRNHQAKKAGDDRQMIISWCYEQAS